MVRCKHKWNRKDTCKKCGIWNTQSLEKELKKIALARAEDEDKCFGVCEACGQETVLVDEVGLCGPCCFGEADTLNGNW